MPVVATNAQLSDRKSSDAGAGGDSPIACIDRRLLLKSCAPNKGHLFELARQASSPRYQPTSKHALNEAAALTTSHTIFTKY
jgi:hypothetical protein